MASFMTKGLNSAKENKGLRPGSTAVTPTKEDKIVSQRQKKSGPSSRAGSTGRFDHDVAALEKENKPWKGSAATYFATESRVDVLRSRHSRADHLKNIVFQSLLNRNLRESGSAFASPVWRGKSISSFSDSLATVKNSAPSTLPAKTVLSTGPAKRKNACATATGLPLSKPSRCDTTARWNIKDKQSLLLSRMADLSRSGIAAAEEKNAQALMQLRPPETGAGSSSPNESSSPTSVESRSGPSPSKDDENVAITTSSSSLNFEGLKISCKAADMPQLMQQHAWLCAQQALDSVQKPQCKHVAWTLKKEFDQTYGPAWHCIVGSSFGSYVTHSSGGFVYFSIGKFSVLLFKTAVELVEP